MSVIESKLRNYWEKEAWKIIQQRQIEEQLKEVRGLAKILKWEYQRNNCRHESVKCVEDNYGHYEFVVCYCDDCGKEMDSE